MTCVIPIRYAVTGNQSTTIRGDQVENTRPIKCGDWIYDGYCSILGKGAFFKAESIGENLGNNWEGFSRADMIQTYKQGTLRYW